MSAYRPTKLPKRKQCGVSDGKGHYCDQPAVDKLISDGHQDEHGKWWNEYIEVCSEHYDLFAPEVARRVALLQSKGMTKEQYEKSKSIR